ncbi:unnamed protein product [Hapterophycus canaliculatus]
MWTRHAKVNLCRGLSSRYCRKPLSVAPAAGRRRSSTSAPGLVEPDTEVLKTLVCPFSKMPLTYDRDARELLSPVGVAFPITANGLPNMMPACARLVEAHPEEEQ